MTNDPRWRIRLRPSFGPTAALGNPGRLIEADQTTGQR